MFLGIDQGTTGTTAILLNPKGKRIGKFTAEVPQHFPEPGWVEHDPEEIWSSVRRAVTQVLKQTRSDAHQIEAIGITNQRETVSLFDGERALHRFIVWQDRRTASLCDRFRKFESQIKRRSGLPVDPYFSGSKIRWLMEKLKISTKSKTIRFRTIDSFLLYRLTGEDATEATNASRTSLMNLKSRKWDLDLFEIFGIPTSMAPQIVPSEKLGFKTKNVGFLPDGIPVEAALGDQQAALFGQVGWKKGAGKITFGTGSFLLVNTGDKIVASRHGLVSTLAIEWADRKPLYALEGSAFICGAWIQWLRDELKIIETSAASEKLAGSVPSSDGVIVIPALSGMGAPFWKPNLRGAILGLTRGTTRAHLARASLEALAFQNKALIDAVRKDQSRLKLDWRVDGGAVSNDLLLQIQADTLAAEIIRPKNLEATSTGVALLAAKSRGALNLAEIEKLWEIDRTFVPTKNKDLQTKYGIWYESIERLSANY
jgi:glycerol kinase